MAISIERVGRERIRESISFPDQGRTKQSFHDETNINNIMARFEKTGVLEHVREYEGSYGDVTGAVSYHDAMNITLRANDMFAQLPAKIRVKFFNNPGVFLEAVDDPDRQDELIELGVLPAKPLQPASEPAPAPEPAGPVGEATPLEAPSPAPSEGV